MKGLRESGHDIHIYAQTWSPEEGVTFHQVRTLSAGSFVSAASFAKNVCSLIRKGDGPDCVISFERTDCQDIYRAGEGCHAEWLRIRSAFEPLHRRLSFAVNPLHRALLGLERSLFTHTPLIVANSRMVKDQIGRHYAVPPDRMEVLYNGVDLLRFSPSGRGRWRDSLRTGLGLSHRSLVLLFVGSGFERKGLRTVIEALGQLRDADTHLLVVGKGGIAPFRNLAGRLGVESRVRFLGQQADVRPFYAAADLFVLPTWYDPFSNATLEAMASGLPVVTTANNGVSELVTQGREGFVTRSLTDVTELARLIRDCRESLAGMGTQARRKAQEFPIERAVAEFTRLIARTRPQAG